MDRLGQCVQSDSVKNTGSHFKVYPSLILLVFVNDEAVSIFTVFHGCNHKEYTTLSANLRQH